ncbi:AmmeMemoRadiSam system protein B [Candidatus Bathyarchaeota archaeon RBG_16_57_9]|nr:MAG: AmmeMemoRadiSam system protein B [Candidatus Bathyarchaeota archaeon RBG_16_57_9]OGD52418.1 MAG: AmmeMemoRadiSam system protein B [Candidatus Bathyarchaeota archaeon RBG_13_60_20]
MSVRRPAVAGAFYPAQPKRLRDQIESCFTHEKGPGRLPRGERRPRDILSVVCPHAGYMYSGPAAAHSYLALAEQEKPDSVVVLGPNHTGWGTPVSIMGEGIWETPLGRVKLDSELARAIIDTAGVIDYDETAFLREHSVEVQVPFLQYIYGEFKLVPICMGYQDLETSREVGEAIHRATEGRDILVVASTDLTHQEPQASANKKDKMIIDAILAMDEERLQRVVHENRLTTCGYGPVSAALVTSRLDGAKKAELLTYYTSGDIMGDHDGVVGYAALKVTK